MAAVMRPILAARSPEQAHLDLPLPGPLELQQHHPRELAQRELAVLHRDVNARADQGAEKMGRHVGRRVVPVRELRRQRLEDVHDVLGNARFPGHDRQGRGRVLEVEVAGPAWRPVEHRADLAGDVDDLLRALRLDLDGQRSVRTHSPVLLRPPLVARARQHEYLVDRKSTRLNSSHDQISYAVFCLKKKKKKYHLIFLKKKKKNKTT